MYPLIKNVTTTYLNKFYKTVTEPKYNRIKEIFDHMTVLNNPQIKFPICSSFNVVIFKYKMNDIDFDSVQA